MLRQTEGFSQRAFRNEFEFAEKANRLCSFPLRGAKLGASPGENNSLHYLYFGLKVNAYRPCEVFTVCIALMAYENLFGTIFIP